MKSVYAENSRALHERAIALASFNKAMLKFLRMEDCMFKHELGVSAESKVAKVKGIITSRSECLYGCNRYYIQPEALKDMKVPDGWWIDEDDIVVKGKGITAEPKNTGGMMDRIR